MKRWFGQLDRILRGDATQHEALRGGQLDIPLGGMTCVVILLGVAYGLCLGSYAVVRPDGGLDGLWQLLASMVKLPLLFLLTLVVTVPSLYVFNALVGSRLSFLAVLKLLMAMLGVMLAVLASLGPIVVFFGLSTSSYPFMKLLNVVCATVAGLLGLAFLLRTLERLVVAQLRAQWEQRDIGAPASKVTPEPELEPEREREHSGLSPAMPPIEVEAEEEDDEERTRAAAFLAQRRAAAEHMEAPPPPHRKPPSVLERDQPDPTRRSLKVFRVWVIIFSLVGAQMSWVLGPFLAGPEESFVLFRDSDTGNFFEAVVDDLGELLGVE